VLFCWTILLFFFSQVVVAGRFQSDDEKPNPEEEVVHHGRQIEILRDYFRKQYPRTEGIFQPNDRFVESFVDRQIDHFLKEVEGRIKQLRSDLETAQKLRGRLIENMEDSDHQDLLIQTKTDFKAVVKSLQNTADDLGDQLGVVFLFMDSKEEFDHKVTSASVDGFFEGELDYLKLQVEAAERLIQDFFFRRTNTVEYEDLMAQNMLVRLYWIEQMARAVNRRIR
jgi:hypothetical protein